MSVSRPQGIRFSDRMKFLWVAVKWHGWLMIFLSVFVVVGVGVIWIASATDAPWFLYGIGGVFALAGLAFLVLTMPSSILYRYEAQVVSKYGRSADGVVTDTYTEVLDDTVTLYYVDYEFAYKSTRQFGTFYVDDKALADRIGVGDKVPIKFLAFDPTQSDVRMRSLKSKFK